MGSKKKDQSVNNPARPHLRYVYRAICAWILTFVALALFLCIWLSFLFEHNHTGYLLGKGNLGMASIIYVAIFAVIANFLKAFKIGVERTSKLIASVVLSVFFTNILEIFASLAILNNFRFVFDLTWRYAILTVCQSIVLTFFAIVMVEVYRKLVRPLSMVMIYGEHDDGVAEKICRIPQKYQIKKSVRYDDPDVDFEETIKSCSAVLVNDVPAQVENQIIKLCFENNIRIYLVPRIADIILKASDNLNVIDTPLFLRRNLGMSLRQRFVKRAMDIFFSGIAVILLSPLFLIIALAIKIEDRGPVFFKQERVTKDGKHFMILKFRSMIVDAEKDGRPHPAEEHDDRITKVGKFIRACRIDELPQLYNILMGDMSIVGPRPERFEHVEKYTRDLPEFKYREMVKGGLTGYSQVYGKYNTSPLDKLKLDLIYIANYSLLLDFQIIFETVKVLFQKESTEGFDSERAKEMHDEECQ